MFGSITQSKRVTCDWGGEIGNRLEMISGIIQVNKNSLIGNHIQTFVGTEFDDTERSVTVLMHTIHKDYFPSFYFASRVTE